MATITITRSLLEQGADEDVSLISAFQRNSLEFDIERGALTGTYTTVLIGAFEFRAVKTGTVGTIDSYIMDVTTILPNLLPIPESDYSPLTKNVSVKINLYDSSHSLMVQDTSHPYVTLSFAYQNIGVEGGLNDIVKKGASRKIYHNDVIYIYHNSASGTYDLLLNGILVPYYLENGYTIIVTDSNHKISGTLTIPSIPTFSIQLYYKEPIGDDEITWLNRDGCWSLWNFRKISEEVIVKKSNDVATYYPTNASTISKSRMISADKKVRYAFDTLAYDPEHFEQLCEIQESLAVIWDRKIVNVVSSNTLTAVCKQNLKFNLVIEIDENVAGY